MSDGAGDGYECEEVRKVSTGINGLDSILHGGLPRGSLTLLSGGPGTGKTMFGMEFLVRGAQSGQPGILLTFEERESALRKYGAAIGWNIEELESAGMLSFISARLQPDAIISGSFDLKGIVSILESRIRTMKAKRVLIDAPDAFLRLLGDPARELSELRALNEWLLDSELTTVMTLKRQEQGSNSVYDLMDYLADCVIHLDQRVSEQIVTRRLRVIKYRGSAYGRNEFPFGIVQGGIWIIPVTQTSLQNRGFGDTVSTGVSGLDDLLDGGYRQGSCTLFSGGSGTGKTTFASSFVRSVTEGGDKVLYIDFEESSQALITCMLSPGIDLRPALENGSLRFLSMMPEARGVEEHLIGAMRNIGDFKPRFLVVDAISACRRMGSEHAAFDYLLRLINFCKQQGITTLLTNLSSSHRMGDEISGIDLSSVIDSVIILRNCEKEGTYVRELAILKSRGRRHSPAVHRFLITDDGIVFQGREG